MLNTTTHNTLITDTPHLRIPNECAKMGIKLDDKERGTPSAVKDKRSPNLDRLVRTSADNAATPIGLRRLRQLTAKFFETAMQDGEAAFGHALRRAAFGSKELGRFALVCQKGEQEMGAKKGRQLDAMLRFRASPQQVARIDELAEVTGLAPSDVLRMLVDNARLEPRPTPVTVLAAGPET